MTLSILRRFVRFKHVQDRQFLFSQSGSYHTQNLVLDPSLIWVVLIQNVYQISNWKSLLTDWCLLKLGKLILPCCHLLQEVLKDDFLINHLCFNSKSSQRTAKL